MIEHLRTFLGYCGDCRQPAQVGEFRLKGWKHAFNMCDGCLKRLSERITTTVGPVDTEQVVEDKRNDK